MTEPYQITSAPCCQLLDPDLWPTLLEDTFNSVNTFYVRKPNYLLYFLFLKNIQEYTALISFGFNGLLLLNTLLRLHGHIYTTAIPLHYFCSSVAGGAFSASKLFRDLATTYALFEKITGF